MDNTSLTLYENRLPVPAAGVEEYVTIGFRWRRRMMVVFLLALAGALVTAYFLPREYSSEMKFLVRKERVDPVVVPDQQGPQDTRQDLSEEELNAEVELMRSADVLRNVVLATGLQHTTREPWWYRLSRAPVGNSEEIRIAKAVSVLAQRLDIVVPKKSTLITVSYASADPNLSAKVLTELAGFYLEKHTSVRRPPGQFEFFEKQAEEYKQKLAQAQARLAQFPRQGGAVAGQLELDIAVQKLGELRLTLQQTQTAIQETRKRIGTLEGQLNSTPARMTTAVRKLDNEQLMMQLNSTLLNLELKRTDLLQKFQPTHRQVQEVDQEIANTRAAIDAANSTPLRDETTDRDPTYEWMRSELAKAHTELNSLEARAASITESIRQSEQRSVALNESSLAQQELLRNAKTLDETYQLYERRREEARIRDALDRMKILNVQIAEEPTVPVLPKVSPSLLVLGGIVFAMLMSLGTAFVSEHLDKSLRNADEVRRYLNVEVLAALPGHAAVEARGGSR